MIQNSEYTASNQFAVLQNAIQETASKFTRPNNDSYNPLPRKCRVSVLLHRQYLLQRTILGYGLRDLHVGTFDREQATRRWCLHSNQ
jgi:hypothetical protein